MTIGMVTTIKARETQQLYTFVHLSRVNVAVQRERLNTHEDQGSRKSQKNLREWRDEGERSLHAFPYAECIPDFFVGMLCCSLFSYIYRATS